MDKKTKKKIMPVVWTVLVILFSLAYIATFIVLAVMHLVVLPIAAVAIVIYLIVCGAIIAVLRERIQEINGGLEDATFNY